MSGGGGGGGGGASLVELSAEVLEAASVTGAGAVAGATDDPGAAGTLAVEGGTDAAGVVEVGADVAGASGADAAGADAGISFRINSSSREIHLD